LQYSPRWGFFAESKEVDVAMLSLRFSPTSVTAGEEVTFTVVVENQGTLPDRFDVVVATVLHPPTPLSHLAFIEIQTVSLKAGESAEVEFSWKTTGVLPGCYNILTGSGPHASSHVELDTEDNSLELPIQDCFYGGGVTVSSP